MGMYDSIDCHYSLPMPEDPKGYTGSYGFQTKDFDCGLDLYVIDKDGRLFIERRETEWIEGDTNSKNFLDKLGHIKTVKTWLEALDHTCTIEFHDYITSDNTDYDYWIQYKATFIRGQISDVKLTNFEATSNSKRKILMSNIQNKVIIQSDDLKFDGKNITIPSYYTDVILDYVKDYKLEGVPLVDIEDYQMFRNFLYDIQEFKNKTN